jgi:hypothetical protein
MMFLVRHAAELFAEHIEGGICIEHDLVLKRYNEATRRLVQTDDPQYTLDQVNVFTLYNSVTLPREYIAARLATICGYPVDLKSQAHELVATGPGKFNWDRLSCLVDEGRALTQFDIPGTGGPWYIVAYSTSADDATKTISFRARTSDGAEVLTSAGSPVQSLAITQWAGGVEGTMSPAPTAYFPTALRKLTGIQLPSGLKGYVTLLAYDPVNKYFTHLSKYHPSETTPSYRRYRLPVFNSTDGQCVTLLCKKQYLPATSLDDVMLIQNPDAVKMMVMSLESENSKDLNGTVAFKQLAVNQMREQMSNESRGIRFDFVGYDQCGVNII